MVERKLLENGIEHRYQVALQDHLLIELPLFDHLVEDLENDEEKVPVAGSLENKHQFLDGLAETELGFLHADANAAVDDAAGLVLDVR